MTRKEAERLVATMRDQTIALGLRALEAARAGNKAEAKRLARDAQRNADNADAMEEALI